MVVPAGEVPASSQSAQFIFYVNRLWQHHFGLGLVKTANDFGRNGDRPSHAELLDWLAAELVRNGWRLKPLHRQEARAGAINPLNPRPAHHPAKARAVIFLFMAGGGIKGGQVVGATDAIGLRAIENPVHFRDLHATILHQLGLDQSQLTYPHLGRRERLTFVEGKVIEQIV